ncbi:MAG TPA: zinc-ribbon domain-containing protein [Gaiellaceae bacterium]|nr:zinc-ribbon domain-containing protein [Gaiellaceae bacterium]
MSAPASCPACGAAVVPGSRFCAQCGRRLDADATAAAPVPVDQAPPRPDVASSEPHLFGVTPVLAAVVVGIAAVAVGILLLALDEVVAGAVVIVVGAALLLLLAAGAPQLRRSRSAAGARAAHAAALVRARTAARRRSARLHRERDELERRRTALLRDFGAAVYRGDEEETGSMRAQVERVDAEIRTKEAEMAQVAVDAREQVRRARFESRPTEMVEVPEYPPPDEGTPPGPAIVPEPYPPPDEGTPPEPARIPEPEPARTPEPEPPTERAG